MPEGAGAFIALLVQAGLPVLPAGVGERPRADGAKALCVSFGPAYAPDIPEERARRDKKVGWEIEDAIRVLLP